MTEQPHGTRDYFKVHARKTGGRRDQIFMTNLKDEAIRYARHAADEHDTTGAVRVLQVRETELTEIVARGPAA